MRNAFFTAASRVRLGNWLAVVVVFLWACFICAPRLLYCLQNWNDNSPPSWVGVLPGQGKPGEKICDVDTRLIHIGFLEAPTLPDTTRWLTGIWVGKVPFYRPLTSYVFWAQWKAWGDYETRYGVVAALLHLLAVAAFARLAYTLLNRYRLPHPMLGTILVGALFLDGLGVLSLQTEIVGETYVYWKNEPDALTLLFFSLCLNAYIQQREGTLSRRWCAVLWYILLCLTKEAGVFLPLLLPIIEFPDLKKADTRRAAILRLLPFALLLPLYLGLRTLFLHDAVGYRYGSNDAWTFRLGSNLAGGFTESLMQGSVVTVVITLTVCAVVLTLLWLARRGKLSLSRQSRLIDVLAVFAVPVVTVLLAAAVLALQQIPLDGNFDIVNALLQLFISQHFLVGLNSALFLLCWGRALLQRFNFGALCYAWALLTLGLTLFSPSVLHRYYLMNAGFAVLIAGGAMLWLAPLVDWLVQRVQQAGIRVART